MTEYDLTLMSEELRDGIYAIEISSLRLVWAKYESCILHAESLRLVRMKYESYILHTSAVMYFSKLKRQLLMTKYALTFI